MIAKPLWTYLALRNDYPDGQCWAWMDAADRRCTKPEGAEPHLCDRHAEVAAVKLAKLIARQSAQAEAKRLRDTDRAERNLPRMRQRLASIDAEIRRRDPKPPTDDLAAYGNKPVSTVGRYQSRLLSDSNVMRMAELWRARDDLAADIARAERLLGGGVA